MQSRVKITNTQRTPNHQALPSIKINKQIMKNFPQVNLHHRLYSFAEGDEPTFNYENTREIVQEQSAELIAFCEEFACLHDFMNDGCEQLEVGSLSEILMFNTWDKYAVMEALQEQRSIADIKINKHICERMEKYLRIFYKIKKHPQQEHRNQRNQISNRSKNQYYTPTNQGDITVREYVSANKDMNPHANTEAVSFRESKRRISERSPIKKYQHYEQSPYLTQEMQKRGESENRKMEKIKEYEEPQECLKLTIDLGREQSSKKQSVKKRNSTHSKLFHKIEISGVERLNKKFELSEQKSDKKILKNSQKKPENSRKTLNKSSLSNNKPQTISVVKSSKVDTTAKPRNSKYTIGKKLVSKNQKHKQTNQSRVTSSRIVSNRSSSREKSNSSVRNSRIKANFGEKQEIVHEKKQESHQRSLANSRYQTHQRKQEQRLSSRVQSPQKQLKSQQNELKFRSIAEQTVYKSNYFIKMLKIVGENP